MVQELKEIEHDAEGIKDRFYRELEFGTGGLRGVIGAGTNRLNIYTIRRATQGLANYLLKHSDNLSAAIAYDSRIKSDRFAKEAASVPVSYTHLVKTSVVFPHIGKGALYILSSMYNAPFFFYCKVSTLI